MDEPIQTNDDIATACLKMLNEGYESFRIMDGIAKHGPVETINGMRAIGLTFQSWHGKQRTTPAFYQRELSGKTEASMAWINLCEKCAREMPKNAETAQEAGKFFALALKLSLGKPRREKVQVASNSSPIQRWFNKFTEFRAELFKAGAMDGWRYDVLQKFIDETDWLAQKREDARHVMRNFNQ